MTRWNEIGELGGCVSRTVLTLGNFDGVHRGHRGIVDALLAEGRGRGLPSVAVLFDPHPTAVLGTKVPPLLTTLEDRVRILEELGIDHVLVQRFDSALAATPAETYVEALVEKLGMEFLSIGPTTHIGKGREGSPERIGELGARLGFSVRVAPAVMWEGELISSSRIRRQIEEGEVERAAGFLGRFYRAQGKVVSGEGRGRILGFPTANLEGIPTLLPARGVYAVRVEAGGALRPAAANVGYRPTIAEHPRLTVEVHLLDFAGSLAGKEVSVEWVARLREERKFESAESLREQIARDCRRVREMNVR